MGTPQSPSHMFNGLLDDKIYNDAKFAHEINDKMRVPKRIKATGEFSDEDFLLSNQNGIKNSWNDKIDMNVPSRIVVLDQDQHLETRSAPMEIQLENPLMSKVPETGIVRIQTPPRVITLNDHHFPSASEYDNSLEDEDFNVDEFPQNQDIFSNESESQQTSGSPSYYRRTQSGAGGVQSQQLQQAPQQMQPMNNIHDMSIMSLQDAGAMQSLPPLEELKYLRRNLAKLNLRVRDIEVNNQQRMQREQIVYCLGLAYFVIKAIIWLNRN